jgi:gliding motility-associated-like protein
LINPSNYGLPSFSASYFDTEVIRVVNQNCGVSLSTNFSNASYYWSFGDPNSVSDSSTESHPSYSYADTGKYTITLALTNNFGCSDTIKKEIHVLQCDSIVTDIKPDPSLSFPNVFSPNGDGVNDSFEIIGLDKYPDNDVVIYNRWGTEVFHKKGNSSLTSFNGNGLSDGVYYYIVSIPAIDLKQKGYVTIIR